MKQTIILVLFSMPCISLAQSGSCGETNPVSRVWYAQELSGLSNEDLAEALVEIRARTQQLQDQIKSGDQSRSSQPTFEQGSGLKKANGAGAIDLALEKKVLEIRNNISVLKKIYAEKKKRKMEAENQRAPSVTPNQRVEPKTPAVPDNSTPIENKAPIATDTSQPPIPQKVTEDILDPLELGNSLMLAGNIEQAIKFYELVDEDKASAFDRRWRELMLACCFRSQKQFEKADASYREVAGEKQAKRTSLIAKQWLEFTASQKRILGTYQEYEKKSDEAIEKANRLIQELENGK